MVGAKKPALMDIVELIPAYDQPAYISHRLACYFIFHLLGGLGHAERVAPGPGVRRGTN